MATNPPEPFETLVARNGPRLWRLARSYARRDLAADLYQEMLMQLWRTLERVNRQAVRARLMPLRDELVRILEEES